MATTNTYLNFNGNCEEAFNFYRSVFGGEYTYIGRYGEMPENEKYKVPDADKNKLMHIALPIGTSVLMGSDTGGEWASAFIQGNNFSVIISTDSPEEANHLFNALAQGGQITMPLGDTFWDDYFGTITDKFGINWMVSFDAQQHKS
jgi:PhnB protein